jgi:hypothetical protein
MFKLTLGLLFVGSIFAQEVLPVTEAQVCSHDYAAGARHVTPHMKILVFKHDGIPISERKHYVIDHVEPLEIGGANSLANLRAQPKREAHKKDKLENRLHKMVCVEHSISLKEAQREIATDWQKAYQKYVH